MSGNPLAHLPAVLSWRRPADPDGALRRRARSELYHRLHVLFERVSSAEAEAFFADLSSSPPASQRRLLDAPVLWERVWQDLDSDTEPVWDALRAERHRVGQGRAGEAAPEWTARGERLCRDTSSKASYHAPRLPQGAVVDWASPVARARVPFVLERFDAYETHKLPPLIARVRGAARTLHRLCPPASALLRAFTITVILRRDLAHPTRFLSESTEGTRGRVLLCNAELASEVDLVEALVHETVHSYLFTVELDAPMLADREAAADLRVRSPWTGRDLEAEAFCHAALVWVALASLWPWVSRAAPRLSEEVAPRLAVARLGFAPGALAEPLSTLAPVLSRGAFQLLSSLRLG